MAGSDYIGYNTADDALVIFLKWNFILMSTMDIAGDRLNAVEILLAHQEKRIEDLNEMVTRQWSEIDRLKSQISAAQERLLSIESSSKDAKSETGLSATEIAALNKPPHY
jgi:SlyX protein